MAGAGYDISAASSSQDTQAQSLTSGIGGSFTFNGGGLNKTLINWKIVAIVGGVALLGLWLWKGRK